MYCISHLPHILLRRAKIRTTAYRNQQCVDDRSIRALLADNRCGTPAYYCMGAVAASFFINVDGRVSVIFAEV